METPSSTTRRVTRSQTTPTLVAAASNNHNNNVPISRKIEEKSIQRKGQQQAQQQDRCALIDISNDSPIVGLATGDLETPLSSTVKQRGRVVKMTPGSGEALLRGQVKTLLQKVEEEAEFSKMDIRPFLQLVNSPMQLLAPTPTNTPQISTNNNTATGLVSMAVSPSSVVQEQLIPQVVNQAMKVEETESEMTVLSRSLMLDFSDKSEVTTEESKQGSMEDDGDSIWSIQVNASTVADEDEEEEIGEEEEEEEEDYYEGVEEEESGDVDGLDELCAGLNNIAVNEESVVKQFAGKHTRFVYDSDDEEIVEEVEESAGSTSSSEKLRLKGLPTPKGKHIRFSEEEGEEEEKSAF